MDNTSNVSENFKTPLEEWLNIFTNPLVFYPTITITIILFLFILISFVFSFYLGDYLRKTRPQWYNEWYGPIIDMFVLDLTLDETKDVYKKKTGNTIVSMLKVIFEPIRQLLMGMMSISISITNRISLITTQVTALSSFVKITINQTIESAQRAMTLLSFYQARMKFLMAKQIGFLGFIQQFLEATRDTLLSFTNGPIPKFAKGWMKYDCPSCFFLPTCFTGDTEVIMNSNITKPIKYIKIGDLLKDNQQVIGVVRGICKEKDLRKIGDTYVTKDHLIFKDKWMYVNEYSESKKYSINDDQVNVYCLLTENSKIITKDGIFTDYRSIPQKDKEFWKYDKWITSNHFGDSYNLSCNDFGFVSLLPKTQIEMKDGTLQTIESINIGDILKDNIEVEGILQIIPTNNTWVDIDGILLHPTTWVQQDERWKMAYKLSNKIITKNQQISYHLITNKRIIPLENNIYIRDDIELDIDTFDTRMLENLALKRLNNQ